MSAPARVAVVGGGITGLATAYRLLTRFADGARRVEVVVLEERRRLGGNIHTERTQGFVIDGGPDAFVNTKPQAKALCEELGLGARLIETTPENRKVYIHRPGELHVLPEGTVLAIPTRFWPLARTGLFSWPGKVRMGLDVILPRRAGSDDESVASLVRRRLGDEALERLADPLLGGIYAGDVEKLSIRSTFPQLAELEERHGSLIVGALAQRRASAKRSPKGAASLGPGSRPSGGRRTPPPSPFFALRGGMGELVEALVARIRALGGAIHEGVEVAAVERTDDARGYRVRFGSAPASGDLAPAGVFADHVIVAAPAHAAARMLAGLDARLASRLEGIPYCSTATVAFAYERADVEHPLDAVGLVLPKGHGRRMLAATFVSSKWVDRAPEGSALLRVFLGGHRDEAVLGLTDDELVELAKHELAAVIGLRARPLLWRVFRFERANPQPLVGHGARLAAIREDLARHPGLDVAGAAYDGVGIPDCIRQAESAAERVARSLTSTAS